MPFQNNITHIMWDWDGPILDHAVQMNGDPPTLDFYWEALARVIEDLGLCGGCEIRRSEITSGFSKDRKVYETLFDYLHHEHKACFQTAMKLQHKILFKEFRGRYELKSDAFAGLLSVQNDYEHAINTHAHEIWLEYWLGEYPQLQGYFSKTFFPKQYGFGDKRKGVDAYKIPLEEMSTQPENVAMVEDSAENLKAAKELGMTTVFLNLKQEKEIPEYVDHVFDSTAVFCEFAKK